MPLEASQLQELMDDVFAKSGVAGASVAALIDGRIVTAVAGVASDATGTPVRPSSVFPLASLSKIWGATAAMTLVDEGFLDLDEPVLTYLPELRLRDPEVLHALTTRHLLTHTHGLDGDAIFRTGDGDDALERAVEQCATLRQVLPLGVTSSYSNTGVMLAARVVERLTGTTWDAAMRQRLFGPLGLKATATDVKDLAGSEVVDAHLGAPGDWQPRSQDQMPPYPRSIRPGGGLLSTASEVLEFVQMHLAGGVTSGGRVLSADATEQMQVAQTRVPGLPWAFVPDHWGLGWMVMDWTGGTTIGHDGGGFGGTTYLRVVPAARAAVVMLTNSMDSRRLMLDIFGPVLRETGGVQVPDPIRVPSPPPPFDSERFAGTYVRGDNVLELSGAEGRFAGTATSPAFFGEGDPVTSELELTPYDPDAGTFLIDEGSAHDVSPFQFFSLPDGTPAAHSGARAFVRTHTVTTS